MLCQIGLASPLFARLVLSGGANDQCCEYSAPELIQSLSNCRCCSVRGFLVSGGGMTESGSVESIRSESRLSEDLPGTMDLAESASSRRSSRRLALRDCSSGPWQLQQWLARIGLISEAKSGPDEASCPTTTGLASRQRPTSQHKA